MIVQQSSAEGIKADRGNLRLYELREGIDNAFQSLSVYLPWTWESTFDYIRSKEKNRFQTATFGFTRLEYIKDVLGDTYNQK